MVSSISLIDIQDFNSRAIGILGCVLLNCKADAEKHCGNLSTRLFPNLVIFRNSVDTVTKRPKLNVRDIHFQSYQKQRKMFFKNIVNRFSIFIKNQAIA